MKTIFKILILVVSLAVLSAWTWRLNMPSLYRGGDALNMIEEFQAYGLNQTTMVVVGIFKVTCAIILLIGLKVRRFVTPAAFIMGLFMIAAVYFHISISDPLVPTLPSAIMLISCATIIVLDKKTEKILMPMQPGDVKATISDTSSLKKWIGFKPNTPIEKGIHEFVKWYRFFYKC